MLESHLPLILMKIRLGVTNKDLAYQFRINYSMFSKIDHSWLVILSKALQPLIVWPRGLHCISIYHLYLKVIKTVHVLLTAQKYLSQGH